MFSGGYLREAAESSKPAIAPLGSDDPAVNSKPAIVPLGSATLVEWSELGDEPVGPSTAPDEELRLATAGRPSACEPFQAIIVAAWRRDLSAQRI